MLLGIDTELGGCVTTVTSRSARPVLLSKSFEVASTINFALPSCNCGVVLTPAVKFQRSVGRARRLRHLEDLIPSAILLDERLQPANATRIAYVNRDGSGLAQGGDCRWEFDDRGR